MQPEGGVGAVQLKPMLLAVVAVTVKPVGAEVSAEQEDDDLVSVEDCVDVPEAPAASTALTT